jgi:hypothetical protein
MSWVQVKGISITISGTLGVTGFEVQALKKKDKKREKWGSHLATAGTDLNQFQ